MKKIFIGVFVALTQMSISQNATALPAKGSSVPVESELKVNGKVAGEKNAQALNANNEAIPLPATRRDTPDTTLQLILTLPDNPKPAESKKTEPKSNPK